MVDPSSGGHFDPFGFSALGDMMSDQSRDLSVISNGIFSRYASNSLKSFTSMSNWATVDDPGTTFGQ